MTNEELRAELVECVVYPSLTRQEMHLLIACLAEIPRLLDDSDRLAKLRRSAWIWRVVDTDKDALRGQP